MSKKSNIVKQQNKNPNSVTLTHQQVSGLIPPPAILEQYQNISLGAPEHIIIMAKQQQSYENDAVTKALAADILLKNHRQLYEFSPMFIVVLLFAYVLLLGYEKFAIIGTLLVTVPLVKVFVLGLKHH